MFFIQGEQFSLSFFVHSIIRNFFLFVLSSFLFRNVEMLPSLSHFTIIMHVIYIYPNPCMSCTVLREPFALHEFLHSISEIGSLLPQHFYFSVQCKNIPVHPLHGLEAWTLLFLALVLFRVSVQTTAKIVTGFVEEILCCNRPKAVVSLLWASVVFVLFIGLIVLVNIAACIFL